MKVLQVASSLYEWGGIERYVHYLDQGLTERGHDVVVSCPPGSPLAERSRVPECLVANRLKYSLKTYSQFRRIGAGLKPDIVHIHFSPDFVMPALALRQTTKAKIIMTRHLVLPWPPSKVRRYTSLFDHIIPVSKAVEEKLAESGVVRKMMTVAKAGVPNPPESVAPIKGDRRGISVGFFGRLVKEKGVDVLLKAASLSPVINVQVYGEGPEAEVLRSLAGSLGLEARAEFKGYVSDVHSAMADLDIVAVPSVWDEAFPYSILEAMAVGKPVVASRTGGIPEVVEDGVTGRLVDRGNPEALANAITEICADQSALDKMGAEARKAQQSEYTLPKMAERVEAVYRMVLEQG